MLSIPLAARGDDMSARAGQTNQSESERVREQETGIQRERACVFGTWLERSEQSSIPMRPYDKNLLIDDNATPATLGEASVHNCRLAE